MWLALLAGLLTQSSSIIPQVQGRNFEVDFQNDTFLMDGAPFKYISGSIHYFRMPHEYWEDRLKKARLLGLNVISTYVEWSLHEPEPGVFNFEGDADVAQFINLAKEQGFHVILRPGPYICAEREFGGFPAWLLKKNPNMKFRTSDPTFLSYVEKWYDELFKHIKPLLYGNGGPIITVQIENEYGNYPMHDKKYLEFLRDLSSRHVENKAVLFTTDNHRLTPVTYGRIPGVFSTIDFASSDANATTMFANLRSIQPRGPLVNSEYYPGWFTFWGQKFYRLNTQRIIRSMESMLDAKVNFNFYMVYGGTNYGFTAGANGYKSGTGYQITSYDYDAPISEDGDLTDKFMAIRNSLKKYGWPVGSDEEIEKNKKSPKGDYGVVRLSPVAPLLQSSIASITATTKQPKNMEALDQGYGFIAYTHEEPLDLHLPTTLDVTARDRTLVIVDNETVAVLENQNTKVVIPARSKTSKLTLLVENLGRRNAGRLTDVIKGIVSDVKVNDQVLYDWETTTFSLTKEDITKVESQQKHSRVYCPAFFSSTFSTPANANQTHPLDTFVDMSGWGKGVVFVNGRNLGRYWNIGPQRTLYVPGVWLKPSPELNRVTVLELHATNADQSVHFVNKPIFL